MSDDGEERCWLCKDDELYDTFDHQNSINHRFNFMKWSYNEYRKALVRDRHGITLEVREEVQNNFIFDFTYRKKRGKYEIKVTPEQLHLHDKTIKFKCTLKNTRSDPIYVTNINLLHFSEYFRIVHPSNLFTQSDEDIFYQLPSGGNYTFSVVFHTDSISSSYKIPLTCDFQTVDNQCFTIVRTFLAIVIDRHENREAKTKSPFTSKLWKGVKTIVKTTEDHRHIDRYPIPKEYIRILSHGLKPFENMSSEDQKNLNKLRGYLRKLTVESYSNFWHTLLWLEERAQVLMLMKYNMEEVTMDLINDDTLMLEVPGLAEKRPSVIIGDYVLIRITGDHTAYEGFVRKVNDKTIEIAYADEELLDQIRSDPDTKVDVSFQLGRIAFERMHFAVDRVAVTQMVTTLFPKIIENVRSHITYNLHNSDFYNKEILQNDEQRNAVMKILNSVQTLPYIVFGPPGTGKTVTILEAILQIKKHTKKKILICAPANSACDLIAEKLIPYCSTKELIRIHSSTREIITITEKLKEYSNMDEDDDSFYKVSTEQLMSYRIVVTTLIKIGNYKTLYRPDCVFIDEAAQACEPESDIALAFLSLGKQVVLAGDPKQLGPMVTDCAAKLGLGVSLLERLMAYKVYKPHPDTGEYDSNFITMLKLNFRSHPTILSIPNHLFYDNNLIARSVLAQQDPLAHIPVFPMISRNHVKRKKAVCADLDQAVEFYSLSSKEKREGSSPSYFNLLERNMVIECVKALLHLSLGADYKVKLDQIGVVTPYKRQVFKILEGLKKEHLEGVEVGTTESFQGREKRIIIISTVRAQHSLLLHDRKYNLGFVKNDQRFNVAITRAISKLIVIGCPLVLRKDDKWEAFITLCREHRTFFGDNFDFNQNRFRAYVLERMKHFKEKDDQYHDQT